MRLVNKDQAVVNIGGQSMFVIAKSTEYPGIIRFQSAANPRFFVRHDAIHVMLNQEDDGGALFKPASAFIPRLRAGGPQVILSA